MPELVIDDTGLAGVTLLGVRKELDLYRVFNTMSSMMSDHRETVENPFGADGMLKWFERLGKYIESLGFPRPSDVLADVFFQNIERAVDNLGKAPAVEPTPV